MSDLSQPIYLPGDKVFYVGEKFRQELTQNGKPMIGYIHWTVLDQPGVFCVEFPDHKQGDFILNSNVLSKYRPSKEEKGGVEVQPRRPKHDPDIEQ